MMLLPLLHPCLLLWILLATTYSPDKQRRRRHSKFVTQQQPHCWYIDGNNVMGHKGTPRDVDTLAHKLAQMTQGGSCHNVKLVLDDDDGTTAVATSSSPPGVRRVETEIIATQQPKQQDTMIHKKNKNNGLLEVIHLAPDISADDFICNDIQQTMLTTHHQQTVAQTKNRIHVVTADRELRRRVLSLKPAVKEVVNPVTFWRRYMPRLCGFKKRKE